MKAFPFRMREQEVTFCDVHAPLVNETVSSAIREQESLDFIDALEPGSVFYDVGACIGCFSLYAALRQISTYAFEADKENFQRLQENLKSNHLSNLHTYQVALGDGKQRRATILIDPKETLLSKRFISPQSFEMPGDFSSQNTYRVPADSLDRLTAEHSLPLPTALRVDMQGAELDFLQGAQKTLLDPSLCHLLFELDKSNPHFGQIIIKLAKHGFSIQREVFVPQKGKKRYNIFLQR